MLAKFFLPALFFSGISGSFQLLITFFENLLVSAEELVFGSNITNGAVQPFFIVITNVLGNLDSGFFEGEGHPRSNAFVFDGFVITLQFAVTLRIKG